MERDGERGRERERDGRERVRGRERARWREGQGERERDSLSKSTIQYHHTIVQYVVLGFVKEQFVTAQRA